MAYSQENCILPREVPRLKTGDARATLKRVMGKRVILHTRGADIATTRILTLEEAAAQGIKEKSILEQYRAGEHSGFISYVTWKINPLWLDRGQQDFGKWLQDVPIPSHHMRTIADAVRMNAIERMEFFIAGCVSDEAVTQTDLKKYIAGQSPSFQQLFAAITASCCVQETAEGGPEKVLFWDTVINKAKAEGAPDEIAASRPLLQQDISRLAGVTPEFVHQLFRKDHELYTPRQGD
ncbi:MAG: hypothetical protein EB060_00930 [Proteobacteria bacterium]|nr:hypothetical protein [Pseudomonadota bacterium]